MARCPRCRAKFRTLDDEADGQHSCPICEWNGRDEAETPHAPMIEQLEGWAASLDAALLVSDTDGLGLRALRLIARHTVDAMRQVAADLEREG